MSNDPAIIDQSGRRMQPLPLAKADAPQNLLEVIARAASDPTVDIDKMDRLLQMREREETRAAEAEFNTAMTAAQTEMGRIKTNKENSQTHSRYADYASLDRALRPIYTRHGFALSFNTVEAPADMVGVEAYVSRGGFTRTYRAMMPADGKGAKGNDVMTKTHATGAAMTYGMRYLLKMIFNVAIGEDDTDGNMPGATITDDQAEEIKKILEKGVESLGGDYGDWLNNLLIFAKADGLNAIPAKDFEKVVKAAKKAAGIK
jgi:hypothetical protein